MRSIKIITIILGLIFCLQGCSTFKGAAKGASEGIKEDWSALKKADDWIQENLW